MMKKIIFILLFLLISHYCFSQADQENLIRSAQQHIKRGEFDKAKQKALESIEIDENYAPAYYILGKIHVQYRNYKKALEQIKKAIELDPGEPIFYLGAANVNEILGNLKEALLDYQTCLELSKEKGAPADFLQNLQTNIDKIKNKINK